MSNSYSTWSPAPTENASFARSAPVPSICHRIRFFSCRTTARLLHRNGTFRRNLGKLRPNQKSRINDLRTARGLPENWFKLANRRLQPPLRPRILVAYYMHCVRPPLAQTRHWQPSTLPGGPMKVPLLRASVTKKSLLAGSIVAVASGKWEKISRSCCSL